MTSSSAGFTTRALATLFLTGVLAALGVSLPAAAGAYATIAPPPHSSTGSGLPDGRVYEEVSPPNKHGFQAGAVGRFAGVPLKVNVYFSVASPDGNAIAYGSEGPAAEIDSSGVNRDFVAERTSHGWTSRSSASRGLKQNEEFSALGESPIWRDYSPDLSHLAYIVNGGQVPGAPVQGYRNIYLLGSNPLEEPTWLLQAAINPTLKENPYTEIVGMSPDASIVYIAYDGSLLPQDASRTGWGLYEYRDGRLSEAGVLPDGSVPASGALPAATATSEVGQVGHNQGENNPASLDNQLSEDGRRVFFVASDELYVHKIEADGSEHSVLVSASQMPGHVGEAAQHGAALFENLTRNAGDEGRDKSAPTYAYASSDGSHVFFQSEDQLTSQAPSGTELKVYDFDVDTGGLEYLPGVTLGGIVTAAKDGSSFAFVNEATSQPELDLWSAGPNGGSISRVTQLPGGGFVGPGRMVDGNTVLVFQASAAIAGFNDGGTHLVQVGPEPDEVGPAPGTEQVYRYELTTNELGCISCPPAGIKPSGDAYLSAVDQYFSQLHAAVTERQVVNDARGVSSDGERIFFSSPDPLVGKDTNGDFDTYEWENGTIFLLSSGTSSDYSLFLDNSESGGDVFFATSDELAQGDNDAGFDVYDARIPRPGDNPPPSAVPCSGDVCQGPPSVAQLLGAPPSATFNGAGNLVEKQPAAKAKTIPKRPTTTQKLASALSACHKRKSKHGRAVCEMRARKRHPATGAGAKHNSRRGK